MNESINERMQHDDERIQDSGKKKKRKEKDKSRSPTSHLSNYSSSL